MQKALEAKGSLGTQIPRESARESSQVPTVCVELEGTENGKFEVSLLENLLDLYIITLSVVPKSPSLFHHTVGILNTRQSYLYICYLCHFMTDVW